MQVLWHADFTWALAILYGRKNLHRRACINGEFLILSACVRGTVVLLCVRVCVSVTMLAATYLFYMLKTRYH